MGRYVLKQTRPKSWSHEPWYDADDHPFLRPSDLTVQDTTDLIETGLLDADGDPIYREPNRIGFIWHDEIPEDDDVE